jgi:hypothetical protein
VFGGSFDRRQLTEDTPNPIAIAESVSLAWELPIEQRKAITEIRDHDRLTTLSKERQT